MEPRVIAHSANASAAAGQLVRIGDRRLNHSFAEGTVALPPVGGRSEFVRNDIRIEDVLTIGNVTAEVEAGPDGQQSYRSRASVSLNELTIVSQDFQYSTRLEILRLEGTVAAQMRRGDDKPSFRIEQFAIREFRIGDSLLSVTFNTDAFNQAASLEHLRLWPHPGDRSGAPNLRLVREIRWLNAPPPNVVIDQNSVRIQGFGRIIFGEVFLSDNTWRLSVIRMELGSPVELKAEFGHIEAGMLVADEPAATRSRTLPPPPSTSPAPAESSEPAGNMQFSAYHARRMQPERWQSLLVYAHTVAALPQVQTHSRALLGGEPGNIGSATAAANTQVIRGTSITIVPQIPGFSINPRSVTFEWLEDLHFAEFRVKPVAATRAMKGQVSFYVGPILIGELAVAAKVKEEPAPDADPDALTTSSPYGSVFVCYAHKDEAIAKVVEMFYPLTGMRSFRDRNDLLTGQDWREQIEGGIVKANIFQLMWSSAAKESKEVGNEVDYAVKLNRKDFIRPFYWQDQMPDPPAPLERSHFVKLEVESLVFALLRNPDPTVKDLAQRLLAP